MAELCGDRARREIAELVAMDAAVGLREAQPLALILQRDGHAVAVRARAGKIFAGGIFSIEYQ